MKTDIMEIMVSGLVTWHTWLKNDGSLRSGLLQSDDIAYLYLALGLYFLVGKIFW